MIGDMSVGTIGNLPTKDSSSVLNLQSSVSTLWRFATCDKHKLSKYVCTIRVLRYSYNRKRGGT